MRYWSLGIALVAGLACGKQSEVGERTSPDEPPAPEAASAPAPADAPAAVPAERGRIAVARVDGDSIRDCYDISVEIDRAHPSLQGAADASLPVVEARPLALLLLDYAIVSGGDESGTADPKAQVSELVRTYVTRKAPAGLSAEERESYADSARMVQSMTWPTETLAHEAKTGALVDRESCSDATATPLGSCKVRVEEPGFAWEIQRSSFADDAGAAKTWCQRHGGDWTAQAPGSPSGP